MNKVRNTQDKRSQDIGSSQTKSTLAELARKYHVEDLSGASIPGSRITNILKQVESGTPLSSFTLEYLYQNGFIALLRYAKNEISFIEYLKIAEPEQSKRRALAESKAVKEETERQLKREAFLANVKLEQEQAVAKKRAYDNDPRNIAKAEQKELRAPQQNLWVALGVGRSPSP